MPKTYDEIQDIERQKAVQKKQDWRQTVTSQHSLHATLAGLQVTALILFISFYKQDLDNFQKSFFILTIMMILIQTICLIHISEHERRDAFSGTSEKERNLENRARWLLNWVSFLSISFISTLLIYSVLM